MKVGGRWSTSDPAPTPITAAHTRPSRLVEESLVLVLGSRESRPGSFRGAGAKTRVRSRCTDASIRGLPGLSPSLRGVALSTRTVRLPFYRR